MYIIRRFTKIEEQFSGDIAHTSVDCELYEFKRTYEWQMIKGAGRLRIEA
ncbi:MULTISPECIES: hypothetical protein [Bacillus cereus group]|nr:hypothetical protein [Bacillus thuringiensis]